MVYYIPHSVTKYELLLKSHQNIFNVDDLIAIWSSSNRREALESIKGYINRGKVYSVFKGIYALNKDYIKFELAQKLYTPSYITYYSALATHGIIFQKYKEVHLFALNSRNIIVDNQKYIYHKVKIEILMNQKGLELMNGYTLSSPERSICDSIYLNKEIAFDNLRNINLKKIKEISLIYNNKRVENDITKLIKQIEN